MEYSSYGSKGSTAAFVSNETTMSSSSSDTSTRSRTGSLLDWDLRRALVSSAPFVENQSFGEMWGYYHHEVVAKALPLPHGSVRYHLNSKGETEECIKNPFVVNSSALCLKDESSSRLSISSSVVEYSTNSSKDHSSASFIDLKLGRVGDPSCQYSSRGITTAIVSPPKRARFGGANSNAAAHCQVYGCNKDLGSSKEYHKRHKVCDVHSKTAKVIVNGIEQRFCQQCSRFHLLAEFDDGKRSCRKRLAGHNERRRKHQVRIHSGRAARLIQAYNGFPSGRIQETGLTSSFICQDILPGTLLYSERYGANEYWSRRVKHEDQESTLSPNLSGISVVEQPLYPFEKMFPAFRDGVVTTPSGSIFSENNNRYPLDVGGSNSSSHCLVPQGTSSLGNDEFITLDAAASPTIQGLSGVTIADSSSTGCALSLLSSQSQSSSSGQSSQIPMAGHHYGMNQQQQVSGRMIRFGLATEASHLMSPLLLSHLEDHNTNGEDTTTIDLLQLSSQLHRVEHEKQKSLQQDAAEGYRW